MGREISHCQGFANEEDMVRSHGRRMWPIDIFQLCSRLQIAVVNGIPTRRVPRAVRVNLPSSILFFCGAIRGLATSTRFALRAPSCIAFYIARNVCPSLTALSNCPASSAASAYLCRRQRFNFLHCLDTPALQELYCCDPDDRLYSFLVRLRNLQKHVVPRDAWTEVDATRLLYSSPTIKTIGIYVSGRDVGGTPWSILDADPPRKRIEIVCRVGRGPVGSVCVTGARAEGSCRQSSPTGRMAAGVPSNCFVLYSNRLRGPLTGWRRSERRECRSQFSRMVILCIATWSLQISAFLRIRPIGLEY